MAAAAASATHREVLRLLKNVIITERSISTQKGKYTCTGHSLQPARWLSCSPWHRALPHPHRLPRRGQRQLSHRATSARSQHWEKSLGLRQMSTPKLLNPPSAGCRRSTSSSIPRWIPPRPGG